MCFYRTGRQTERLRRISGTQDNYQHKRPVCCLIPDNINTKHGGRGGEERTPGRHPIKLLYGKKIALKKNHSRKRKHCGINTNRRQLSLDQARRVGRRIRAQARLAGAVEIVSVWGVGTQTGRRMQRTYVTRAQQTKTDVELMAPTTKNTTTTTTTTTKNNARILSLSSFYGYLNFPAVVRYDSECGRFQKRTTEAWEHKKSHTKTEGGCWANEQKKNARPW